MKKLKLFTAAVLLVPLLAGCSDISFGEQTMLRPPRATGDKAQIQSVIDGQAGSGYILKYPQRGEYRSAITVFNPDEGNEYAVALYSTENDSKLNISIIANNSGNWECLGSFSAAGTGVDRVMLEDINNDGISEILVGWSGYSNGKNMLCAYSLADDTAYEMKTDGYYTDFLIDDITGDENKDIVFLTLRGGDLTAPSATVLQYSDQEKRPIARYAADLDPEVTSFAKISSGYISNDTKGIFIDGEKSGGLLSTQLICFDAKKNTLINPLLTVAEGGTYTNPTTRKDIITCRDMDGDGKMEFPVVSQLVAPANTEAGTVCSMTTWMQYEQKTGTTKPKCYTVINYTDGYCMTLPNEWLGNITALNDPENRSMSFYVWNSKTLSAGDRLLTIRRFTWTEWTKQDHKDLILVYGNEGESVIAAEILHTDSRDNMDITKEQLKRLLRLLSEK